MVPFDVKKIFIGRKIKCFVSVKFPRVLPELRGNEKIQ